MDTKRMSIVALVAPVVLALASARADLIDANGQVWSLNATLPAAHYYAVPRASDGDGNTTWVTSNPAADYFSIPGIQPVLLMDLGADVTINSAAFWNYSTSNANNASQFTLRFATAAEGPMGVGHSIAYAPTFAPAYGGPTIREDLAFATPVTARWVEMTITDNYRGMPPNVPGGDRVGFGDIQFDVTSLPTSQATISRLRPTATPSEGNPSSIIDGSAGTQWYSPAKGGDYFGNGGTPPVLVIDLGQEQSIDRFDFTNYSIAGNRTKGFSLRFATEAEGPAGFGGSIALAPSYTAANDGGIQPFSLGQFIKARYVEMTITSNYVGGGPGGDRVGFAEIDFYKPQDRPIEAFLVRPTGVTSSTANSDYFPAANLIDGDSGTTWVSANEGTFFNTRHAPILTFDLGKDMMLAGLQLQNYPVWGNGLKDFVLAFATEAEGPAGMGASIDYSPIFTALADNTLTQEFLFDHALSARYVSLLTLDNYAGWGFNGGDRVGFTDVNFLAVPEPATLSLALLMAGGLGGYLRRRR
ncbi:MAG: F5/8 type C domain protein [Planctomycetes bacterium ADurb.Bin126]|nr:MAG: F5/8 type C domain protein [Planctomycetes bacterium ADurb.Bin126]HOD83213.1 discoidin domain-containing protein [Phycisphaerae bacterium]HQL71885.1 discoidin domain-containing protein [Phycisphaerae bacterium]